MATPSLLIIPDRYKAAKLYSQIPESGAGDFTVTRGTTATRVNASGLIESVASGVPRIDYTGGGCGSLLVEPAATNLALYSEDFTQAVWAKTVSASVSGNTTVSPDGTTTADTFTAGANGSQVQQVFVGVSGTTYNVSFYIKRRTGSGVVNIRAVENVNTPITITNNWTRVSLSATATSTSIRVGVTLATSGDAVDIWGAQLETGSVATSYIPTVATTQTRNADVISLSSVSGLIGQTEGTLYAEVDVSKLLGTVVRGMLTISNNTTANRIQIGFTGASANTIRVIYSGASTLNYNFAITTTGIYKIAFAYSASSTAFYVNGSLVSALGGNSFSASVGNVYLGSVFDGTSALNDRISAAAIYTSRLSNSELAQLTTL